MTERTSEPAEASPSRYRVRLPGFVRDQDVGLGDAVSRVTASFGVRPCGRCRRRAARLNRWVRFEGRPR